MDIYGDQKNESTQTEERIHHCGGHRFLRKKVDIDQFGVDVTVTSFAAVRTLCWQKNAGNKWRETGKIHGIRENMYCCDFGCHLKLNTDV